ncbi:type 1 glutamine amidotransferase domain-containing protein [Pseudofrankia sp. BMG5.36]|uniref:type 1 glutamine amidotransferase domain-containing protein n=1 Tax=Pseudofrankia sp. BMG5.36 TaxID=1834512 RepID=UPI0008DA6DC0|nr:type 1 glutamine amidotransferase domain-containing protein [Pseudofrankia sp. BMG5.36]OHV48422.1 glutamine amidotransferase [Pseudofrankia sp. BMG5.36]
MSSSRTVLVLTSHARFGDTDRPTGFWYEELAAPYYVLADTGIQVTLASPAGGQPPADPASLAPAAVTPAVDRFRADSDALAQLGATVPLDDLDPRDVDSVFLAGGHGTMWDFPDNPLLAALLTDVLARGGTIGAVCHGAAALVGLTIAGRPLVDGRALTAFSDTEEDLVAATDLVPFSLEQRLRARGARYTAGLPFVAHALRDGQLVTGQNPASSAQVAELLIETPRPARTAPTRP